MDVLEKIREEERAKLEALKEKEQEKTRLAIEKERTRLEAELAKEIKDLESQLNRAKNASQKVKARTPVSSGTVEIPSILVEDDQDSEEIIEVASKDATTKASDIATSKKAKVVQVKEDESLKEEVLIPAKESSPTKKVSTIKKAAPQKRAPAKTAAQKAKEKEKARLAKEKEKEKAKLVLEKAKAKEKEKLKLAKEKEKEQAKLAEKAAKAKEAEIQKIRLAEEAEVQKVRLVEEAKEAEIQKIRLAEEAEAKEAEIQKVRLAEEAEAKAVEIQKVRLAEEAAKEAEIQKVRLAEEKAKLAQSKEYSKVAIEGKHSIKDEILAANLIDEKPYSNVPSNPRPNTAMTSLQKLREKIAAQKRLEKELMEREAQKVQEKEKTLQEKFISLQKIVEEEENLITLEELEQERINVDGLRREKEDLEDYLGNLQEIIDRVVDLRVDGIKVIDSDTWELTEEFQSLGIDTHALNRTVAEIEEEVDSLALSHQDYINKLIKAEENYKTLETLYHQQEKLITDLNNQVVSLREQVAKEKVLNKEYSSQIARIKNEKSRLERIYKYNLPSQKYYQEDQNDEVYGVLSDLDRLNEEVRKLIEKDQIKKVSNEALEKDKEIENLKKQLEEIKGRQVNQEVPYPYYSNPANMFIPSGYPQVSYIPPQPGLDIYLYEVEKLRKEIDSLKQVKMEEPVAKPEVFKDEIAAVEAKPKLVEDEKPAEAPKAKAKTEEESESQRKVKELEKQILDKDKQIENIKKQMAEYTEEDIFDPNFKRKIRVIRDKKVELDNRSLEEEQIYLENTKEINKQAKVIKSSIDAVRDRLFDLDLSYRQNRDYSSATKDEYEKTKGKALVELQLQEEKLKNYNEDIARAKQKYDKILNNKEEELDKLKKEEVETIKFYLNKMIQDNKIPSKIKTTEQEKQNLVDELDQLKSDNDNPVTEIDAYGEDRKKQLSHKANNIEAEIREQTRQYNIYYEKITDLKNELNKRVEIENNLKQNDDDVFDYTSTLQSLEECDADFKEKNEQIALLQLEIESSGSADKDVVLRKKAQISDLIVHREDLKTKMDFFKTKLEGLEANNSILTYKKINNQINQIKKVSKDHRLAAEAIKADVQTKTTQLEKLRNDLKGL